MGVVVFQFLVEAEKLEEIPENTVIKTVAVNSVDSAS